MPVGSLSRSVVTPLSSTPSSVFDHLERLCDDRGLFEHAAGIMRRTEHGYCTDDNARLLVVATREPDIGVAHRLGRLALDFTLDAQTPDGQFHNRMDISGQWTDEASTQDWWGRGVWALGTAATQHGDPVVRRRAREGFDAAVWQRSPWPRSMAYAALGAAEVAFDDSSNRAARSLLVDAIAVIGPVPAGTWTWPEPRLTYANAMVAEAVIAAGAALGSDADLDRGLTMLAWLLDRETASGHLSVTGVGGQGPGDSGPQFDQQPIEVAALADACWRAFTVTGDRAWLRGVDVAAAWFMGDNDNGLPMRDAASGGGYDGLHPASVNLNQGAESTLAFISTMQRARSAAHTDAESTSTPSLATETGIEIFPDRTRVITRLFVPGREDVGPGDSRAAPVIERILDLDEAEVEASMRDIDARFMHRHTDLHRTFENNALLVSGRIDPTITVSTSRRLLLGASFTHEYAIEGAALCNPSIVAHPQQDASDAARFILSVRGIGEGHRSSIGFRTGTVTAGGDVSLDQPGRFPRTVDPTPCKHHRSVFHAKLAEVDDDRENAALVLDLLPTLFDDAALEAQIEGLAADVATRKHTSTTIENLRSLARSAYTVEYPDTTDISERVLWPHAPAESHGMEDARFVRFTDESGDITYYATYTAFDGINICQHLLVTKDFLTFTASPMGGIAATGKGLALFPRKIHGQYAALSRSDRETNAIAFSDDLHCWDSSTTIQVAERAWEILQLGNCGSPIETSDGWLVLTHGVGPMRTYSLSAILLDLAEPQRVIARSVTPILAPGNDRRDGYVPNVIYSCGGFAHGDVLVLPYGIGDQTISIATLSIRALLDSMQREP